MGPTPPDPATTSAPTGRQYLLERVGEAAVVQLYADGFRDLPLRDKILVWHLAQASIAGRDIFYDQRYAHNLEMRDVLEAILTRRAGVDPATLAAIERYTKLFWINTGPYNNLTARKFVLTCTPDAFAAAARAAARDGARMPLQAGESVEAMLARLRPMFFDPEFESTVTSKTPPPGHDILTASSNNFYVGVTMQDLEGFEERHPLNSRLVKRGSRLEEEVYRIDGRYGAAIAAIVRHLEAAIPYATEPMAKALRALITFYQTGREVDREAYDIAWVQDKASMSTRSTASSRSISMRAASRAPGKRSSSTSTARRRPRSGPSPNTRSGSRTACRGTQSTGRKARTASRPTPSTSSSRRGNRGRSRRSGSTCRTIRRSGNATAASRCRCRTSGRRTTSRCLLSSAKSLPGRPRR